MWIFCDWLSEPMVCLRSAGLAALAVLSIGTSVVTAAEPAAELLGLPLLFQDDFEKDGLNAWAHSDPRAWKISTAKSASGKETRVASQFQQSDVKTPVRSPFNRSVIKDLYVGDFVLDVKLQSTKEDYPHRDMCLFFGYQDPAHLYYVHFGKQTDDHANQIFIVNGEPRKKISTETTSGTNWNDEWHHARIVRTVETGSIAVYFDDMDKPVMRATDKTFVWGQVGVGSFDDIGNFDDVLVYGKKAAKPE